MTEIASFETGEQFWSIYEHM